MSLLGGKKSKAFGEIEHQYLTGKDLSRCPVMMAMNSGMDGAVLKLDI